MNPIRFLKHLGVLLALILGSVAAVVALDAFWKYLGFTAGQADGINLILAIALAVAAFMSLEFPDDSGK